MRVPSSKYQISAAIFILLIVFAIVYFNSLDKKLSLVGDNVHYYLLGKSLAQGSGYTNIYTFEESAHQHFPPGYPAIISIVYHLFPENIYAVKILNGLFFFFSIVFFFLIVMQLTNQVFLSFISSMFLLLNQHLLSYSFIIMSDIPFIFFSLLCILILLKSDFKKTVFKNYLFFILIISIAISIHIRSIGVALFLSVLVFLMIKKLWPYALSLGVSIIVSVLPWILRNKMLGGSSYLNQLMLKNPYQPALGRMGFFDWIDRIIFNFERYFTREIPQGIFNFLEVSNMKNPIKIEEWYIGAFLILVITIGYFNQKKLKAFLGIYIALNFIILLLWPFQWYGPRFLIPTVPFLSLFLIIGIYEGLNFILRNQVFESNQMLIKSVLLFLFMGLMLFYIKAPLSLNKAKSKFNYPPAYSNMFKQAEWFKYNTQENALFICENQAYFYFFSNRKTISVEQYVSGLEINNSSDIYLIMNEFMDIKTLDQITSIIRKDTSNFQQIKNGKEAKALIYKLNGSSVEPIE